jgi:hypothetical protein
MRDKALVAGLTHVGEVFDQLFLVGSVHELIKLYVAFEFSANCRRDFKVLKVSHNTST